MFTRRGWEVFCENGLFGDTGGTSITRYATLFAGAQSALTSALTTSTTTVSVTTGDGTNFTGHATTGDYVQVGNEIMYVSAVSTDTLTISRGQLGTTAASHSIGDAIVALPKTANQCNWTSFARQSITGVTIASSSPYRASVASAITFPIGATPTTLNDATHWGIFEAATPAASSDGCLYVAAISNNPDPVENNDTIQFAANQLYFDGDIANSALTYEGWKFGVNEGGLIPAILSLALFTNTAMTTEFSGDTYARIAASNWSTNGWDVESASTGRLRLGDAVEFPVSGAAWTIGSNGRLAAMDAGSGGNVLFGQPATGLANLVTNQKFTIAANTFTLVPDNLYPDFNGA